MDTTPHIQVLIADDHAAVREGLAALIERQKDMCVVAQACNGEEAIALFRVHRPDVTLMDLRMPVMNGIGAIRAIRADFPQARILVVTAFEEDGVAEALLAGAAGYILKGAQRSDLIQAIHGAYGRLSCGTSDDGQP